MQSTSTVGLPLESNTSLALISRICIDASFLIVRYEDHSCRRTVAALKIERQRDQLILTRSDMAQVQAFNNDDVAWKQHKVGGMLNRLVWVDRQIVDPDKPDTVLNQEFGGLRLQINELLVKTAILPMLGIVGFEQHAL